MQELVLAQVTVMMWGSEEIDWADIWRAVHTIREIDVSASYSVFPPSVFDPIARLSALERGAMAGTTFMEAIRLARPLECSDSRDRIYDLLGLCLGQVEGSKQQRLLEAILPDYTKSVDQVYWDFAVLVFELDMFEDMLRLVHHGLDLEEWHQDSSHPWVRRWDNYYMQDFPALPACQDLALFCRLSGHETSGTP